MSQKNKSVLFNTSAGTDVQYSGPELLIAGLDPMNQGRIINFSQINYRAEVSQVVTIGGVTAFTPVGNTAYVVEIGDSVRVDHGYADSIKLYKYVTPSDITTLGSSAPLQREAIFAALILKINKLAANYVTAVSLTGGAGFTVTDKPGYFPYNKQGQNNRKGASLVRPCQNTDGTGFSASNYVLTTPAVYEFGTGLNLLNANPVYDFITGNLISGEIETPVDATGATAVSGQKYNMFSVSYLKRVALPTAFNGNSYVYLLLIQTAYADNGAGASAVNLAGYINFERSIHRGLAYQYVSNPTAQVDFLDNVMFFQGPAGVAPVGTSGVANSLLSDAKWIYTNIGLNSVLAPTPSNGGLIIDQTLTAAIGAEYTPSLSTLAPKEFTVGKIDFSIFARISATTMANCTWLVGFHVKTAVSQTFSYSGLAAIGSTAAAATIASTQGSLNGTVVSTATPVTLANATNYSVEVLVSRLGVVTCKLNDVVYPVYSVGTTPLVLPAGMIVVPFFRGVNVGGSAALLTVSEVLALASASWKA